MIRLKFILINLNLEVFDDVGIFCGTFDISSQTKKNWTKKVTMQN